MIKNRIIVVFVFLALMFLLVVYSLFSIVSNEEFANVATIQSAGKINLKNSRGTIYDCNLQPLTNSEKEVLGVALPVPEVVDTLKNEVEIDASSFLSSGKPITFYSEKSIQSEFIDFFEVDKRYVPIASNLIGYIDYSGHGVTGVELAFDDILSKSGGALNLSYNVDALGRMIVGAERNYTNTLDDVTGGVVLTIDKEIQEIAEKEAEKLTKGAIVVVSVPDCEIKALVSYPDYDPNDIVSYLDHEDSPMINRAFASYAPGSVFKLITSMVAIKYDYKINELYECRGMIDVNGTQIECYGGHAHGNVNLQRALQHSCNGYFINLALTIGEEKLWDFANILDFDERTLFYNEYGTTSGNLSTLKNLSSDPALANFAIGQGDLTVTPVKVAELINTIASYGFYTSAKLYKGEMLENGDVLYNYDEGEKLQVITRRDSLEIMRYMETAVLLGTGRDGAVEGVSVGAKTGTAETNVFDGWQELYNFWYAGYLTIDKSPEYAIVVMSEGITAAQDKTEEIFKNIGTEISKLENVKIP